MHLSVLMTWNGQKDRRKQWTQEKEATVTVFPSAGPPKPQDKGRHGERFYREGWGKGRGGKKTRKKGSKKKESEKYMFKATPLTS